MQPREQFPTAVSSQLLRNRKPELARYGVVGVEGLLYGMIVRWPEPITTTGDDSLPTYCFLVSSLLRLRFGLRFDRASRSPGTYCNS